MSTLTKTAQTRISDVPAAYLPLHKYLDGRYADTVVLTLVDIEALLGFALPNDAHVQPEWWSNADADRAASPQIAVWMHAHRIARPNLTARNVLFERQTD